MPLSPDKKQEVIKDNAVKDGDTGSAEVQIAIMQATGAGDWLIAMLFGAEVAIEGLIGGLAGALAGVELARWVGRSVFRAGIEAPPILIPLVIVVAVLVALLGAALPLRRSLAVSPAMVLREGV